MIKATKQMLLGIVAPLIGCVAGGTLLGYIGLPWFIMCVFDLPAFDILDIVLEFCGMVGAVIGGTTGFFMGLAGLALVVPGLILVVKRFNHGRKAKVDMTQEMVKFLFLGFLWLLLDLL